VKRVPGLALRTTFIVGFPGETDADFRRLEKLVDTGVFEHVGVFPYSFEPRSPSARLPGLVPTEVVNERWQRLLDAHRRVKAKKDAPGSVDASRFWWNGGPPAGRPAPRTRPRKWTVGFDWPAGPGGRACSPRRSRGSTGST
jgi:hypothetical protein